MDASAAKNSHFGDLDESQILSSMESLERNFFTSSKAMEDIGREMSVMKRAISRIMEAISKKETPVNNTSANFRTKVATTVSESKEAIKTVEVEAPLVFEHPSRGKMIVLMHKGTDEIFQCMTASTKLSECLLVGGNDKEALQRLYKNNRRQSFKKPKVTSKLESYINGGLKKYGFQVNINERLSPVERQKQQNILKQKEKNRKLADQERQEKIKLEQEKQRAREEADKRKEQQETARLKRDREKALEKARQERERKIRLETENKKNLQLSKNISEDYDILNSCTQDLSVEMPWRKRSGNIYTIKRDQAYVAKLDTKRKEQVQMAKMVFDMLLKRVGNDSFSIMRENLPRDSRMIALKNQIQKSYLRQYTGNDKKIREYKASLHNLLELSCDILVDNYRIVKNKKFENPMNSRGDRGIDWAA